MSADSLGSVGGVQQGLNRTQDIGQIQGAIYSLKLAILPIASYLVRPLKWLYRRSHTVYHRFSFLLSLSTWVDVYTLVSSTPMFFNNAAYAILLLLLASVGRFIRPPPMTIRNIPISVRIILFSFAIFALSTQVVSLTSAMAYLYVENLPGCQKLPWRYLPQEVVLRLASTGPRSVLGTPIKSSSWSSANLSPTSPTGPGHVSNVLLAYDFGMVTFLLANIYMGAETHTYTPISMYAFTEVESKLGFKSDLLGLRLAGCTLLLVEMVYVLVGFVVNHPEHNLLLSSLLRGAFVVFGVFSERCRMESADIFSHLKLTSEVLRALDHLNYASELLLLCGLIWAFAVIIVGRQNMQTPFEIATLDRTMTVDSALSLNLARLVESVVQDRWVYSGSIQTPQSTWIEGGTDTSRALQQYTSLELSPMDKTWSRPYVMLKATLLWIFYENFKSPLSIRVGDLYRRLREVDELDHDSSGDYDPGSDDSDEPSESSSDEEEDQNLEDEFKELLLTPSDRWSGVLSPEPSEAAQKLLSLGDHFSSSRKGPLTRAQSRTPTIPSISHSRRRALQQPSKSSVDNDDPVCVVCMSEPRDIITWPCGCFALCDGCRIALTEKLLEGCVNCRRKVESFSHVR